MSQCLSDTITVSLSDTITLSDDYAMGGDPLYRPALYRVVGSLPISEHEVWFINI